MQAANYTAHTEASNQETPSENKHNKGIGDLTASDDVPLSPQGPKKPNDNKRGRSRHSSNKVAKDGSLSSLTKRREISKTPLPSEADICRVLNDRLNEYRDEQNGKLKNGTVRLIANPNFLKDAYSLIKSKPGNKSKGSTPQTLDGINID